MDLDSLDKDGLRSYVDLLIRHLRLVDAFWYIFLEQEHGPKVADHFNELVWHKVAGISARDIKERFGVTEKGLDGFVKALNYFPWRIIVGFDIDQRQDEVIITIERCPTQTARLERNMGEYECKEMHWGEFRNFAKEIDPSIVVECLHAPPDPHPPERMCQWRFTVAQR